MHSFIENYLYSIDKSHGTWKIGHDNVLCWQKQKVIWQEIQCFTNKCNYNRECGLAICWAKTHIQINLELKNKYHFRSCEIVKYVSTPSFCRPHPTPFLLQTFRPQPTPLPPSDPPPPTPGTRYHSMHKGTNPFQPKSAIWHRMPLHAQYLFNFFLKFPH